VPVVSQLNLLAVQSLHALFDEEESLFCRRVVLTEQGLRREGTSRKRTVIALLGLQRILESGGATFFDVAAIQDAIFRDVSWVRSAGDLGLFTWFTAICAPERLPAVFDRFDLGRGLDTWVDGRQAQTRGLSWFLAGISHARQSLARTHPDLADIAATAYHRLLGNQSDSGIFGHKAHSRSICKLFSSRFGTFADQIYAVYALTTFARAFEIDEPLESALNCANSLCALQGEMGQWWFLYEKTRGRVANKYPVYSAHQDGTAPAALIALEEATGQNFHKSIWKGLAWVTGANELGDDLRSSDRTLIWDSIGPRTRISAHWKAALRLLRVSHEPFANSLGIRCEARPDHFGWLLYAFGRFGLPNVAKSAEIATAH
jgi:hypothetical protein